MPDPKKTLLRVVDAYNKLGEGLAKQLAVKEAAKETKKPESQPAPASTTPPAK